MLLDKLYNKIKQYKAVVIISILLIIFGVFIFSKNIYYNTIINKSPRHAEAPVLKIGFLTDIEYGTRKQLGDKLTRRAPIEMAKATLYLNQEFHPDIVIGGGDYIESSAVTPVSAKEQLREINEIFSLIQAPRLYALGNHDLRSLSKDDVREVLEISENHSLRDIENWRIIVIDTNFTADGEHRSVSSYTNGNVSQEELNWLRDSLKTDLPVLVFSHHSPISYKNNPSSISNSDEVISVLEEAANVVAVISGHTPTSYHERLNGINYFIANTMVNTKALGSFVTIEASYDPTDRKAAIIFKQLGAVNHEYQTEWIYGEKGENYKSSAVKKLDNANIPETKEQ